MPTPSLISTLRQIRECQVSPDCDRAAREVAARLCETTGKNHATRLLLAYCDIPSSPFLGPNALTRLALGVLLCEPKPILSLVLRVQRSIRRVPAVPPQPPNRLVDHLPPPAPPPDIQNHRCAVCSRSFLGSPAGVDFLLLVQGPCCMELFREMHRLCARRSKSSPRPTFSQNPSSHSIPTNLKFRVPTSSLSTGALAPRSPKCVLIHNRHSDWDRTAGGAASEEDDDFSLHLKPQKYVPYAPLGVRS